MFMGGSNSLCHPESPLWARFKFSIIRFVSIFYIILFVIIYEKISPDLLVRGVCFKC